MVPTLPIAPALLLTALAILFLHWFPPFIRWRLTRPQAYTVGVTAVGLFLTWHQLTHPPIWWHYWAFFVAAGLADFAAYGLDKWLGNEQRKRVEAAMHQRLGQYEYDARILQLKVDNERRQEVTRE